MEKFCNWINEYKTRVCWDLLFREGPHGGEYARPTKYHDIPIAMQIGIFLQYVAETDNYGGIEYPAIHGMATFATIPLYIQEFFEYENRIHTHKPPIQPIRIQSDAAADQSSDQADIERADGRGDEADEEWEAPYDGGDASRPE